MRGLWAILVVLVAVLSCLNSGLYVTSRTLFNLAGHGDAPQWLVAVNRRQVPARAILVASLFSYGALAAERLSPDKVFSFLLNSSGVTMLLLYLMVAAAQLRLRARFAAEGRQLQLRMWFHPFGTLFAVAAMLSVILLPRQFQVMVVENVDERHVRRAAWAFPAYLLAINVFVLPIAAGGLLFFGAGRADAETFVLSLPLAGGHGALALTAFIGGLSAATGMVIVEAIAISTMVCNDLVLPLVLRLRRYAERDLTGLILGIRRTVIVGLLLLGWLYFRIAGDAYALVSIGLISFAAVAQFAPALLGGMYWKGGTRAGALAGLAGGFLLWTWTLLLPSIAKSGWLPTGFLHDGPFGIALRLYWLVWKKRRKKTPSHFLISPIE